MVDDHVGIGGSYESLVRGEVADEGVVALAVQFAEDTI